MTTLNIEGKRVKVDDSFKSLSPEEQQRTVEEIAAQMQLTPTKGPEVMGQVNRGIAQSLGGLVDFINPFDDDVWKDTAIGRSPLGRSAREGLTQGMEAIGASVSDRPPEGLVEGMASGAGIAAGSILPVVKGLQALRSVGGAVGAFADDAVRSLSSLPGLGLEVGAGAIAGGAEKTAEAAGAPEWVQQSAAVLAPMSIPAVGATFRGGARLAEKTPVAGAGIRMARDVARVVAPMTDAGARQGARQRLQELAGGPQRAEELAQSVTPNDPLQRTPAQQTGDPNLLGLEASAASESPLLRERLTAREAVSREAGRGQIDEMGGDVADARTFFSDRLKSFKASMTDRVERVMGGAASEVDRTTAARSEGVTSSRVVDQLKSELEDQLAEEGMLWAAVPDDVTVQTEATRTAVSSFIDETPWAQRRDIPADLREAFGDNGVFGETSRVAELRGLYSEMRRVARSAMAGNDQNKNRARIANGVADAILEDLGAVAADTDVGRAINTARAFSRSLHETFDQGDVGRILKRTIDGDETMTPEGALRRTVGRGGPDARVSAENIERAAPGAASEVKDYLRGRFASAIMAGDGSFTPKQASTWLRNNAELLSRYPSLRAEFGRALSNRNNAEAFAARAEVRTKAIEGGAVAGFNSGQAQKAVQSILTADRPAEAARSVVATARKDQTGAALAGVKGAFTDFLIGKAGTEAGISGAKLSALLKDQQMMAAMRQVFDASEMQRLQRISTELAKIDAPAREVGPVLDSPASRVIEVIVRMAAVRGTANMRGGAGVGESLQLANMSSGSAMLVLQRLTNDRARQVLMDAIEDPELFRALLTTTANMPQSSVNKLTPYLTGGAAVAATDDGPQRSAPLPEINLPRVNQQDILRQFGGE